MAGTSWVLAAASAFVGTHFLLSHPLRRPIVAAVGKKGFSGIYSLIALATFIWMIVAFRAAPATAFLWPVGATLWGIATLLMLIASILLMGSFIRNPALSTGGAPRALPEEARGVFAITRRDTPAGFLAAVASQNELLAFRGGHRRTAHQCRACQLRSNAALQEALPRALLFRG